MRDTREEQQLKIQNLCIDAIAETLERECNLGDYELLDYDTIGCICQKVYDFLDTHLCNMNDNAIQERMIREPTQSEMDREDNQTY